MSVFRKLMGQEGASETLRRALAHGSVHHAYRFEGPKGVGKEVAAMCLAQSLVCEQPQSDGQGCGECSSCKRAASFSPEPPAVSRHPDVLYVEKGLYPPAALGRSRPETQSISVDQIRKVVLSRMAYPPHEARHRVVIVRAAEELSVGAANAFLKTLEEPPERTHFILLTSQGRTLLDTIRSRSMLVRFKPLADGVLAQILRAQGHPPDEVADVLPLAGGSMEKAISLLDSEARAERNAFVELVRALATKPHFGAALEKAGALAKNKAALSGQLSVLSNQISQAAVQAVGRDPIYAETLAHHYQKVIAAQRQLAANAGPAFVLERLIAELRRGPQAARS